MSTRTHTIRKRRSVSATSPVAVVRDLVLIEMSMLTSRDSTYHLRRIVGLADTVSAPDCSKPHLGYDFDSTVQSVLRAQNVDPNALKHALTAAFVLHPIGAHPASRVFSFISIRVPLTFIVSLILKLLPFRVSLTHIHSS